MINQNSMAIAILCSHLCVGENIKPLEPREWSELAQKMLEQHVQPSDLLEFGKEDLSSKFQWDELQTARILRLIDRGASLSFELSKYENMGINIVTRADAAYPAQLKKKLGNACPPLFYYAGNLQLLSQEAVGYAGSRAIDEADISFTRSTVQKTVAHGFSVVSGGAKGVDRVAEEEALDLGGQAVAYLADSMRTKIKNAKTIQAIQQGKLLLLSVVKPDSGFNTGIAMMRNRYIYAQSAGTVVIRADYNKGGTWAGAVDNLKNEWCPTFCWNNSAYRGNKALIQQGAIPIEEAWDGDVFASVRQQEKEECEQMSLFDGM